MTRAVNIVPLAQIDPRRVLWLWQNRIPAHELTLVAGPEGVGKSTFLAHLAAQATHGLLPGDFLGRPCGVAIAALEDDEASTLRPRVEAAGADLNLVAAIHVRVGKDDGALTLPDDLPMLTERLLAPGALPAPVGLLIVDPIKSAATAINPDRDTEVRALLAPLVRVAQSHGVTIIVSGHFKKGSTTEDRAPWKVSGSPAWTQVPRSTLFFAEDAENEDDDDARLIAHAKCNVGRRAPTLQAKVTTHHVNAPDGSQIETSRLTLGAESEVKAEDIGRRADDNGAGADARAFLTAYLHDGQEHNRRDIIAAAAKEGLAERTVRRAANSLKVKMARRGTGTEHRSVWSLPAGEGSNDLCGPSGHSQGNGTTTQATRATQATPEQAETELARLRMKGLDPDALPPADLVLVDSNSSVAVGGTAR